MKLNINNATKQYKVFLSSPDSVSVINQSINHKSELYWRDYQDIPSDDI